MRKILFEEKFNTSNFNNLEKSSTLKSKFLPTISGIINEDYLIKKI